MAEQKISQTKRTFPAYVKKQCLAIVQGYDDRQKWYIEQRNNILNSTPSGYTTYIDNGIECRQYNPHVSGKVTDVPYDKTVQLDALEHHIKVKQNRAVDDAKLNIGVDIKDESLRQKLIKAIIINCEEPRRYPHRYLDVGISEDKFYEERNKFLYNVAQYLRIV